MKDWKKVLVSPIEAIRNVIHHVSNSGTQIALVIDDNARLLGVVTDGDIRRGILRGISMDEQVSFVMNPNPITVYEEETKDYILYLMKLNRIHQIPVVNKNNQVVRVEFIDELIKPAPKENQIILMAGGLGNRLKPLTDHCPKPLLRVGTKPILETIIENFIDEGFGYFYIAINYKAEMVQEYFGDGSRWGADIKYIHEEKRMGTAGALSLIRDKFQHPVIVMNGDLLTKVSFSKLLDFHIQHEAKATMCVRNYDFQVPYGVVKVDDYNLMDIEEKPIQRFFVSAGIYVLEPEIFDYIPKGISFDMPSLFKKLIDSQQPTVVFPIREYWLDIGRIDDFEKANGEYDIYFKETAVISEK